MRVVQKSIQTGAIAILAAIAGVACVDSYCQSGPRYGTQCYSGATVRQNDPLAPVAPMPPVGHSVRTNPFARPTPTPSQPPPQNPFAPKPRASAAPSIEPDAGADAGADASEERG